MKIILYAPSINTGGGTERVLVNLANELTLRGYIIEILTQNIGNNKIYDLNKSIIVKRILYDIFFQRFNHLLLGRILNKLIGGLILQYSLNAQNIANTKAIISFSNSITINLYKTKYKVKIIAFEHWPYWKAKKNTKLLKKINKIYPKLKKVIVLTEEDKKNYQILGCNVSVIPNAYSYFPDFQSNLTTHNVLSIGHFNDQKRRDLLVKSWKLVNDKHPDWTLTIIGDGSLKFECIQLIYKLNLQNSIKIVDPNKNINNYYIQSSIFVLSSEFEALPLVLMEAKTFGIPCISFDVETGPKEVIRDGIDGFLVPFLDINGFSEKICLLIEDLELRKKMGVSGRNDSKIKYDPFYVYKKWDNLLSNFN